VFERKVGAEANLLRYMGQLVGKESPARTGIEAADVLWDDDARRRRESARSDLACVGCGSDSSVDGNARQINTVPGPDHGPHGHALRRALRRRLWARLGSRRAGLSG
jgi:hypothetical protein